MGIYKPVIPPIPVYNTTTVTVSAEQISMTGFKSIAIACAVVSVAFAADCLLDQPRKEGDPSGAQIAKAVGDQTELTAVCDGRWRVNDERRLENSYNHGRKLCIGTHLSAKRH